MKKIVLLLTLVFVLGLCACGGKEEIDEDATKAPENETVATTQPTKEATAQPTEAPEKKYDVYVNGKGFDIGDKVDIKVSIKANDKKFEGCCPSLNFYKEGVKDAEKI